MMVHVPLTALLELHQKSARPIASQGVAPILDQAVGLGESSQDCAAGRRRDVLITQDGHIVRRKIGRLINLSAIGRHLTRHRTQPKEDKDRRALPRVVGAQTNDINGLGLDADFLAHLTYRRLVQSLVERGIAAGQHPSPLIVALTSPDKQDTPLLHDSGFDADSPLLTSCHEVLIQLHPA